MVYIVMYPVLQKLRKHHHNNIQKYAFRFSLLNCVQMYVQTRFLRSFNPILDGGGWIKIDMVKAQKAV